MFRNSSGSPFTRSAAKLALVHVGWIIIQVETLFPGGLRCPVASSEPVMTIGWHWKHRLLYDQLVMVRTDLLHRLRDLPRSVSFDLAGVKSFLARRILVIFVDCVSISVEIVLCREIATWARFFRALPCGDSLLSCAPAGGSNAHNEVPSVLRC